MGQITYANASMEANPDVGKRCQVGRRQGVVVVSCSSQSLCLLALESRSIGPPVTSHFGTSARSQPYMPSTTRSLQTSLGDNSPCCGNGYGFLQRSSYNLQAKFSLPTTFKSSISNVKYSC